MHLYSAFIVYCHTPKALYNRVGVSSQFLDGNGSSNRGAEAELDQHFLEFQVSMSPLAQTFQSQMAQRSQELQKNLAPYSEELSKLDPYAQDLKAQLTALWESFAKNKQS